ncbi:MAG: hypothetical protein ACLQNG_08610 [Acidimicrobiales bacterium]|jgi:hypothetical protein
MKWSDNRLDLESYEALVGVLRALRTDGYPLARYERPVIVEGGGVLLQEWKAHGATKSTWDS